MQVKQPPQHALGRVGRQTGGMLRALHEHHMAAHARLRNVYKEDLACLEKEMRAESIRLLGEIDDLVMQHAAAMKRMADQHAREIAATKATATQVVHRIHSIHRATTLNTCVYVCVRA